MGDRFVVGFESDSINNDPIIFLYGHWGGEDQHHTLAAAIDKARPRWHDFTYATRIAISHIVGTQWQSETGFGIYPETSHTSHGSDYRHILIVDWTREQVRACSNDDHQQVLAVTSLDEFTYDPEHLLEKVALSYLTTL